MAIQFSTPVKNARADSIEASIGTLPQLRFYTGSIPADCATVASGTLIADGALPADYMAAAANGVKAKSGTWAVTGKVAAGAGTNAGYFRVYDSAGTTCHAQGTISHTSGGGDMKLDNINVAENQVVTVATFQFTEAN